MMISWDHVSQYDEWPSQWSYFYGFKCTILTARWWRDRDVVLVHIGAGPEVTNSSAGHNGAGLRPVVVTLGLNGAGAGHLYTSTPGGHQLSSLLITQLQLGTVVPACLVQIVLLCCVKTSSH